MSDLEDAYHDAVAVLTQEQVDTIWAYVRAAGPDRLAARMGAEFEPRKYSADWLRQQIGDRTWLPLRNCSICGTDVGYVIDHDNVWFRSTCDCTRYAPPYRHSSFAEIADTLARQTSDEHRDQIMERMLS